jgi:hypothetical protein
LTITTEQADKPDERTRCGPRWFVRRIVSIMVAGVVAVAVIGAALAALSLTGHLPLSGIEGRVAASINERVGSDWDVKIDKAALSRVDGHSALTAQSVVMLHKSGFAVRAPEGVFSYDPWALITGRIIIRSVELKGLNISLGVDKDGALALGAGDKTMTVAPKSGPDFDPSVPRLSVLLDLAEQLTAADGHLAGLDAGAITDARVTLVGPDGQERIGFDGVQIRFSAIEAGLRRITYEARGPLGPKRIAVEVARIGDTGKRVAIDMSNIPPADLLALATGQGQVRLDGLVIGGQVVVERSGGADTMPEGRFALTASSRSRLILPS